MNEFRIAARVRIIQPDHPLNGIAGTVRRVLANKKEAWILLDSIPDHMRMFLPPDSRQNFYFLGIEQCEEIKEDENEV